ncbi:MAG: hypothetical protein KY466_06085 [Gemmatimonadetes bacterium]|nr:hypothetical protein [Gemmatimonadota bacterium]
MRKLSFRPIALTGALTLLLSACDETMAPAPHAPPDAGRAISDAAHGDIEDQNPGFWWLPPMVDQATLSGSFQSAFSPTVKVILCRKSLDETVTCEPGNTAVESPDMPGLFAEFGIGTGLTVEADHFKVELDTDAFGLEPTVSGDTTVYRILAFTDALPDFGGPFVMGYADFQLADTGNEVKKLSGEDTTTIALVDGRTLPIRFFVNEEAYPHELVTNSEATEAAGIGALCEINCSITVVSTEDTTEASLVDDDGVERTAILFEPGDVSTSSVLVIDERIEEGEGANCAVGVNLEKKNCFRYEITPSVPFNNPVRMGICPVDVPKGQGVWRILQVDDGAINRPPEVDVSDFLSCPTSTAFLHRVLDWIIRPLYAEDFDGAQLQGTSDLFWSLDAEASTEPGGTTAEAGSTLPMTVTIVGTHPEPDVPLEGEPVDFLIALGAGSLAAPAGVTPESTTLAGDGATVIGMRLLTDVNGEATVDWTVAAGDNTLEASTPEAEGGPLTFDVAGIVPHVIDFETLSDGSSVDALAPLPVTNQLTAEGAVFRRVLTPTATPDGVPVICTDPFDATNHVIAVGGGEPCSTASDEGITLQIRFTDGATRVEFDQIAPSGVGFPFVTAPGGASVASTITDFGTYRIMHRVITHSAPITEIGVGATAGEVILVDDIRTPRGTPAVFESVSALSSHTCATAPGGAVFCWGADNVEELGAPTIEICGSATSPCSTVPLAVAGGITFASTGDGPSPAHTCGIAPDGRAFCWGWNGNGQLGDGTTTNRDAPALVSGGLTWHSISTGGGFGNHTCAVTTSGSAYCWGLNERGQLGNGNRSPRATPDSVAGGIAFQSVSAGGGHTCGIRASDGAAFCWGYDQWAQLGAVTTETCTINADPCSTSPLPVSGGLGFASIHGGLFFTCGLTSAGEAYCWGRASEGQLGTSTTEACPPPFEGVTCSSTPLPVSGGHTFAAIATGSAHACGVTTAGAIYCWGDLMNEFGFSFRTSTPRLLPDPATGPVTWAEVSAGNVHTCALTSDGRAFCWGGGGNGRLGNGVASNSGIPVPVSPPVP